MLTRRPTTTPHLPYTTLYRSRPLRRIPRLLRRGEAEPGVPCHRNHPPQGCRVPDRDHFRRVHGHDRRSEEHTSELQSHVNFVCRLLLEKKKPVLPHSTCPPRP